MWTVGCSAVQWTSVSFLLYFTYKEQILATLAAHIQPNVSKLIEWHFTIRMDNEQKRTVKATEELNERSRMFKSVTWRESDRTCVSLAEIEHGSLMHPGKPDKWLTDFPVMVNTWKRMNPDEKILLNIGTDCIVIKSFMLEMNSVLK